MERSDTVKAILVLEMPKYCIDCPCHFAGMSTVVCGVNKEKLMADDIETYKPDWCPLRPVPEKKKYDWQRYDKGYNACIDEILDDKE
jgi:hypothetical protein